MGERMRKVSDTLDRDPMAAADGPGVSMILRNARLARGEDLRTVANTLRIRFVYLQAIEDGRFSDLPGNAYAAGFLRSYAEHLELDADMILRRFKEEASGVGRRPELYFPTPVPEGRMPGGTILLGTLVLAGMVYGSWYYLSATDRSMVDYVPALPDRLVSLLDALPWSGNPAPQVAEAPSVTVPVAPPPAAEVAPPPPAATAPPATATAPKALTPAPAAPPPAATAPATAPATAAQTTTTAPAVTVAPAPAPATPAAPTATTAAPPRPAAAAPAPAPAAVPPVAVPPAAQPQTAVVPPAEEDEPEAATQEPTPLAPPAPPAPAAPRPAETAATTPTRVFGNTSAQARILLRATQDSWIQVRDSSTNELLFTRVLRPGDVYRVPDKPGIRVRTGNAGGLIVVTDGVDGPPMGAVGQVLRDVPLDPPPARQGSGTSH